MDRQLPARLTLPALVGRFVIQNGMNREGVGRGGTKGGKGVKWGGTRNRGREGTVGRRESKMQRVKIGEGKNWRGERAEWESGASKNEWRVAAAAHCSA